MSKEDGKVLRTFWVDEEEYKQFKMLCVREGVIPSMYFRRVIKEFVNKYTIYKKD